MKILSSSAFGILNETMIHFAIGTEPSMLFTLNAFLFTQEKSTGNILEDHNKAVEGILSDEIKKQTEIINKSLAKQSNDIVLHF